MADTTVAAQLYTLREFLKTPADIARTLPKVAALGYRAVQLSALGPIDTRELKQILDSAGLTVCASAQGTIDAVGNSDAEMARASQDRERNRPTRPARSAAGRVGLIQLGRLPVVSAGAEYLVMGFLMRRNILTYKAPPNNELNRLERAHARTITEILGQLVVIVCTRAGQSRNGLRVIGWYPLASARNLTVPGTIKFASPDFRPHLLHAQRSIRADQLRAFQS